MYLIVYTPSYVNSMPLSFSHATVFDVKASTIPVGKNRNFILCPTQAPHREAKLMGKRQNQMTDRTKKLNDTLNYIHPAHKIEGLFLQGYFLRIAANFLFINLGKGPYKKILTTNIIYKLVLCCSTVQALIVNVHINEL